MTDPFAWSFPLGRWGGTRYRGHVTLPFFAALVLLRSAWIAGPGHPTLETLAWLSLLAVALAVRQLSQEVIARRIGADRDEVRVWPLGELVGPVPTLSERSPDAVLIVAVGLVVSLSLAIASAIALGFAGAQMVFNPFGVPESGGAPFLVKDPVAAFQPLWFLGWFGYLNWVLFVANLLPALPLDGGRMFRAILSTRSRDSMIGPYTAHTTAAVIAVIGLVRWFYPFSGPPRLGGPELVALAFMIEWYVRVEARIFDEGGFFDEGVFGYDFSQGYTSLEAGTPTVRPYRESALKRWRRRRSEARRHRQEAREAAEEKRMDEILDKLHRGGRGALTDEEQRFLVRASLKLRKKVQGS